MDIITDPAADLRSNMQRSMQAFAAAWHRGDIDGLMALMSPDPIYRTSSGAVFEGREEVRRGFTKICQPSHGEPAPPSSRGTMEFFGNRCISYWTLQLEGPSGISFVEGVDIIIFDEQARLVSKDAYRKLA